MATHADPRPQASKLTYEDYVTLPNDGRRYEILDGELAVSPSPRMLHQRVLLALGVAIHEWAMSRGLGEVFIAPVDVILDRTTVVVPDLVFVSIARASIVTERAIEGAPDFLVEILSDSTARHDRGAKMKLYAQYGVSRYWIVDADARALEIYALRDGAYEQIGMHRGADRVVCDVPAGLELRLADIWPA
jgi:Uma2 family endonuclease